MTISPQASQQNSFGQQAAELYVRWCRDKVALDHRSEDLAARRVQADEKRKEIAAIPGLLKRAFTRAVQAPATALRAHKLNKEETALTVSKKRTVESFYAQLGREYAWSEHSPARIRDSAVACMDTMKKIRQVMGEVYEAREKSDSAAFGAGFSAGARGAGASAALAASEARRLARSATASVQQLHRDLGSQGEADSALPVEASDFMRYAFDSMAGFGLNSLSTYSDMTDIRDAMDKVWQRLDDIDTGLRYNNLYVQVDRAVALSPQAPEAARLLARELRSFVEANADIAPRHRVPDVKAGADAPPAPGDGK